MLSCRSAIDSTRGRFFLSVSHRQPHQHIIDPARAFYPFYRLGSIVRVPKDYSENTGSMRLCVIGLQEYPRSRHFPRNFHFSNGILGLQWQIFCGTAADDWFRWAPHSTNLGFRLLHDGNGCLLSILLVPLLGASRQRADGWLVFLFLYIPKNQAYDTGRHACVQ